MNLESLKKEATITSTKSLLIYHKWISVCYKIDKISFSSVISFSKIRAVRDNYLRKILQ